MKIYPNSNSNPKMEKRVGKGGQPGLKKYLHVGVGDVGQSDLSGESLFPFGVVVSQADLQLDRLHEFSLFSVGEHIGNARLHKVRGDFAHFRSY